MARKSSPGFQVGDRVRWFFYRLDALGVIERVADDAVAPELSYSLTSQADGRPVYVVHMLDSGGEKTGKYYGTFGDDLRPDDGAPVRQEPPELKEPSDQNSGN